MKTEWKITFIYVYVSILILVMTDENKILSTNLNNDQQKQLLPLILNDTNENNTMTSITSTYFIHEKPLNEITNDEKSTIATLNDVPGTPAARATN